MGRSTDLKDITQLKAEGNFSNWVRTKEVFPAEINDKFIQAFIRRLFEYEARQDSLMMDVLDL